MERELLTSPWTGADCRRVEEESVGIEVDTRLTRTGFTLEGRVSPPLAFSGVTVAVLLKSLMSDAFEIVLDFGMAALPATDERRDMREGVSDWVEGRFEYIVENGQSAGMDTLLLDDPGMRNAQ